jgi:hypothetical protein
MPLGERGATPARGPRLDRDATARVRAASWVAVHNVVPER